MSEFNFTIYSDLEAEDVMLALQARMATIRALLPKVKDETNRHEFVTEFVRLEALVDRLDEAIAHHREVAPIEIYSE